MQHYKSEILMLKVAPHTPYIRGFTEKMYLCNKHSIMSPFKILYPTGFFLLWVSACRFTMYFSIGNVCCDSC